MKNKSASIFSLSVLLFSSLGWAVEKPHVQADMFSEVMTIQPAQSFWVAVRLKMDPEWHTYWKNPGDSGIPTKITWTLPPGFKAGPIQWPTPKRIEQPPLTSFGYESEVMLLTEIIPPAVMRQAGKVAIQAHVDWLECKESCIPGKADLKINLPVAIENPIPNTEMTGNFSLARFLLPIKESEWKVEASQDDNNLSIVLTPPTWFKNENPKVLFYPDEPGVIDNAAPQKLFFAAGKLVLMVQKADVSTKTFDQISGILTADYGWSGPQTENSIVLASPLPHSPAPYHPPTPAPKTNIPFGVALMLAFAGGVLLNLMPCVLPVLSIKVLGFIKQGQEQRERLLHSFLYLIGVLVSFWALAGGLLFLRKSGESVGWGFQLQSPTFVVSLAALFFVMALNLFGVFEIGLSLTRLGDASVQKSKGVSSFLSGVLATIVATPCTAPFMSSALGYALTVGPTQSMLIFTSLGLGMAIPYVILSAFPQLVKFLPKPGPWMDTFKEVMGFLFMATVAWLIWVLERQGGLQISTVVVILICFAMAGWGYGKWQKRSGSKSVLWAILSALFLGLGILSGSQAVHKNTSSSKTAEIISWEPYSLERVQAERRAGRPVFIDFTAAWCLTCQVNERVAFSSAEVIRLFKEKNIAAFKADWTSKDEKVTEALNKLGRNGVPVYAYYKGGSEDEAILLPEILTPRLVLETIQKLSK